MRRDLTCIICPRGCSLTVENLAVSGNACPRGSEYAIAECTDPRRTVTSIVTVSNRTDTMVSVKTEAPIPKARIPEAMVLIRSLRVCAPVRIGDVLARDVCGTALLATKDIL